MDSLGIIKAYISKNLPAAEFCEGLNFISKSSGLSDEEVKMYMKNRKAFLGRKMNSGGSVTHSDMSEFIARNTGLGMREVQTINYFHQRYRIEKGLSGNSLFLKIYPTLDTYLDAYKDITTPKDAVPSAEAEDIKDRI